MPAPALLNVPVPAMAAARVSVSVKLATIWPSLAIVGVLIAPASPPMPRLSVLPATIVVPSGALTTPPSATVSVPSRVLQPQPKSAPIASGPSAFKVEPGPVTITVEVPPKTGSLPTKVVPLELTTPPLAITREPGPPKLSSPTASPVSTFQVEPGPVTVTVGRPVSPGKGKKAMIAPPWLLSVAPLLIVSVPGAKLPTNV